MYHRLAYRRSEKIVGARELKVGQAIWGYSEPDGQTHSGYATITVLTPFQVSIKPAGNRNENTINAKGAQFAIEMSAKEFVAKYEAAALKLMESIRRKIHATDIGCKVMDNRWCIPDPYEMAAHCNEEGLVVLGHCDEIKSKRSLGGEDLDIALCAQEVETEERIWCHAASKDLDDMEACIRRWHKKLEEETS